MNIKELIKATDPAMLDRAAKYFPAYALACLAIEYGIN
jgi:hypothetical protein